MYKWFGWWLIWKTRGIANKWTSDLVGVTDRLKHKNRKHTKRKPFYWFINMSTLCWLVVRLFKWNLKTIAFTNDCYQNNKDMNSYISPNTIWNQVKFIDCRHSCKRLCAAWKVKRKVCVIYQNLIQWNKTNGFYYTVLLKRQWSLFSHQQKCIVYQWFYRIEVYFNSSIVFKFFCIKECIKKSMQV